MRVDIATGLSADHAGHRRARESNRWCGGKEVLPRWSREAKADSPIVGLIGSACGEPPSRPH